MGYGRRAVEILESYYQGMTTSVEEDEVAYDCVRMNGDTSEVSITCVMVITAMSFWTHKRADNVSGVI